MDGTKATLAFFAAAIWIAAPASSAWGASPAGSKRQAPAEAPAAGQDERGGQGERGGPPERPCAPFLRACLDAGFSAESRDGQDASELSRCVDRLVRGENASSPAGLLATAPEKANAAACAARRKALRR